MGVKDRTVAVIGVLTVAVIGLLLFAPLVRAEWPLPFHPYDPGDDGEDEYESTTPVTSTLTTTTTATDSPTVTITTTTPPPTTVTTTTTTSTTGTTGWASKTVTITYPVISNTYTATVWIRYQAVARLLDSNREVVMSRGLVFAATEKYPVQFLEVSLDYESNLRAYGLVPLSVWIDFGFVKGPLVNREQFYSCVAHSAYSDNPDAEVVGPAYGSGGVQYRAGIYAEGVHHLVAGIDLSKFMQRAEELITAKGEWVIAVRIVISGAVFGDGAPYPTLKGFSTDWLYIKLYYDGENVYWVPG